MASVTPLPGASAEPIANRRWRGREAEGVFQISKQRYKRWRKEVQRRADEMAEGFSRSMGGGGESRTGAAQADGWPFPHIERERFYRLTWEQQVEVQGAVRAALERLERW